MTPSKVVLVVVLGMIGFGAIFGAFTSPTPVDSAACANVRPAMRDRDRPFELEQNRLRRAQASCQQRQVLLAHPGHAIVAVLTLGGAFVLLSMDRLRNMDRLGGLRRRRVGMSFDDTPLPTTLVIPELNLHGVVKDPAGAVWWIDVPAVGPSRLVGTWPAAEAMHVLVGVAGSWTVDLGVHSGGCQEHVQLPSPRACICIASATVRDVAAPPINVRMTVDLPGEQADARLVA